MAGYGRGQLGGRGGQAQALAAPGVDAAQEGIHHPLLHLPTEAGRDQGAHGHVAPGGNSGGRQHQVEGGPGQAPGRHGPGPGQADQVGGDAQHQALGEGAEPAPRPDEGPVGRGGLQLAVQAQLPAQLHPGRGPGHEGVGSPVNGPAPEMGGHDLAPGPAAGLQDHDPRRRPSGGRVGRQLPGRGQARHPGAHHRHRGPAVAGRAVDGAHGGGDPARAEARSSTRPARVATRPGSSLSDAVRTRVRPRSAARARASTSMS